MKARRRRKQDLKVDLATRKQKETSAPKELFSFRLWLILMLVGAALIALRTPHYWSDSCFYAEDGVIFFRDQMIFGWRHIFSPYNGYLHLLPRLAALAAVIFPVVWHPLFYGLVNVCVQSAAACFFFLPENRFLVRSDGLRLTTCLLIMTGLPGDEMLDNVLSLHFYLFPVALLILGQVAFASPPLSRKRILCYSALMAVICLTVPLLTLAFPLALWFAVRLKNVARLPAVVMAVLTLVQAMVFRFSPSTEKTVIPDPNSPVHLVLLSSVATAGSWFYRVLLRSIFGAHDAMKIGEFGGEALAVIFCITLCILAYWISAKLPNERRWIFRGMVLASLLLIGTTLVLRNLLKFFPDFNHFTFYAGATRYFVVPTWLLFVGVAMLADRLAERYSGRIAAGLLIGLFAFGVMHNYRAGGEPGCRWAEAAPRIEEWREKRDHQLPRAGVAVPINPPPYAVTLP